MKTTGAHSGHPDLGWNATPSDLAQTSVFVVK